MKRRVAWKKVIKIFLISFLVLFLLMSGVIFWAWLHRTQIEKYVIELLNQHIDARIYIEKIDYTVFQNFPDLTIVLHGVRCVNFKTKDSVLLQVKTIGFSFNLWDLLKKNYVLNQINVMDGFLNMQVTNKGVANYEIWKTDTTGNTRSRDFIIELKQIQIKNVAFTYKDNYNRLMIKCLVNQMKAQGNFYENVFDVKQDAEFDRFTLELDSYEICKNKKVKAQGKFQVNTDKFMIMWSNADLRLENVRLKTQGHYHWENGHINAQATLNQTTFKDLFSLLPHQWLEEIKKYEIKGNVSLDFSISGKFSKTSFPAISSNIRVMKGHVMDPDSRVSLHDMQFSMQLKAQKSNDLRTYVLEINDLSYKLDERNWKSRLKIRNFLQPSIKFEMEGEMNLSSLQKWFKLNDFKVFEGEARVLLRLDDKFDSFHQMFDDHWDRKKIWTDIKLHNVTIQYTDMPMPIEHLQARLNINENKLFVDSLSCVFGNSDVSGKMTISPWIHLFSSEEVIVDGQIYSQRILYKDIDTVFISTSSDGSHHSTGLPLLTGSLKLRVDEFLYGNLSVKNIKGRIYVYSDKIIAENFTFQSLGGKGKIDAIVQSHKDQDLYNINVDVSSIDVRELFYEFNNFDQTTITYNHIRGKANVKGNVAFDVSKKGEVIDSTIGLDFIISMENGELIGYAPLNDLKKYLKDRDFEHVRFEKLNGRVVVADQTVYLDRMLIKSSVGNLWIEGMQTFDGKVEYQVEIKYSELKRKKIKSAPESEYGEVVRSRINDPSIYIGVTGTVDNPKFEVSGLTIKEIVKENIERQRSELKEAFQKEFLFKKRDTIHENQNKKPIQPIFKVEWEDE
ncbi:MAG: AsmA-like C-terminal region-containing protein [Bacteroidales bacterium]|nr:AsmA-like C-terminal region-containing protein [Bacteroidales bacterium]